MGPHFNPVLEVLARAHARERFLYHAVQEETDFDKKRSLRLQHHESEKLLDEAIGICKQAGVPITRQMVSQAGLSRSLQDLGCTPAKAAMLASLKVDVVSTTESRRAERKPQSLLDRTARLHAPPPPPPPPVVRPVERPLANVLLDLQDNELDEVRVTEDFLYFCEHVLEIPYRPGMLTSHPHGGEGPFIPTELQRMLVGLLYQHMLIDQKALRLIILKSRQLGCTTLLLAWWLWLCLTYPNFRVLFIIDKNKHNKTKRHQMLMWCEQVARKSKHLAKVQSKDEHFIIFSNQSMFMFESAEAPNPGTSEMLRGLHSSEQPKWPDGRAQQVRESILPGIPRAPLTLYVNESTAEGMDDFYTAWCRAEAGGMGDDAVIPVFFPWFVSKEYATKPPPSALDNDKKFIYLNDDKELWDQDDGTDRMLTEEEYSRQYKLTPAQTYWRRIKIKIDFEGNSGSFNQEYPTTPGHAFRKIGTGFFNKHTLDKAAANSVVPPIAKGSLVCKEFISPTIPITYDRCKKVMFEPDINGELLVWEYPIAGEDYFAGGDVAEGITVVNESGEAEPDYTVFVIKNKHGRTVAMYRSHIKPEEAWPILLMLVMWYNMAFLNCEYNGPGMVLRSYFFQTGYPNNLVWPTPEGRSTLERMWTTIRASQRKSALAVLRTAYAGDWKRLVSEDLLKECRAFIVDSKSGKPRAASGHHDDIILAEAHCETGRLYRLGLLGAAQLENYEPVVEVVIPPVPLLPGDSDLIMSADMFRQLTAPATGHANKGWGDDFW